MMMMGNKNARTAPSLRKGASGSASDATMLLLHGLGVDSRMWSPHMQILQEQGQILAPDLPGFGSTPPLAPAACRPDVYADWVAARIREHTSGAVAVAGYSMGGSLALLLALRHPELVTRLAICCSSPCWGLGGRRWLAESFAGVGRNGAMELFQGSVRWSSRRFIRDPTLWRELVAMLQSADRTSMLALYRRFAALDLRSDLHEVDVPALVVCGTRDWLAPPSHARILAEALPHGRLVTFRRAGHLLCLSHSAQFAEILKEFFICGGTRGV